MTFIVLELLLEHLSSSPLFSLLTLLFRALKLCGSGGPPHVKLIIEWEHRIKDWSALFSSSVLHPRFFFWERQLYVIICLGGFWFFFVSLFGNIQEEVVKDADNVRNQQQHIHQHSCTLDECFYLYTKEEQVMSLIPWNCGLTLFPI